MPSPVGNCNSSYELRRQCSQAESKIWHASTVSTRRMGGPCFKMVGEIYTRRVPRRKTTSFSDTACVFRYLCWLPTIFNRILTNCERIVRILVARGADVNTETRDFGNALHLASFMGSEFIVKLLLDKGANIDSCGGYFETALLAALAGQHLSVVELLVSKGIRVNTGVLEHGTALHYACSRSPKSTIQLLADMGQMPMQAAASTAAHLLQLCAELPEVGLRSAK